MIIDYDTSSETNPLPIAHSAHYTFMYNYELLLWTDLASYVEGGLIDEDDKVVILEIERRKAL
jgi:hypothetical protein